MQNLSFPKVSVIIPVYNAGLHFRKCLESLVNQTLKELEIILVLDRPTDGSDHIAEKYAGQYPNIILIHNEVNLHIGHSRNKGLQKAQGKYIGFIDHDDYVEPEAFEEMYRIAETGHLDILLTDIDKICIDKPDLPITGCHSDKLSHSATLAADCFRELLINRNSGPGFYLYAHLFRRDFLKSYNAEFVDTRKITSEDLLFNLDAYCHVLLQKGKIHYLPKVFYHHTLHQNNTGSSIQYREIKKFIPYLEKVYHITQQTENILSSEIYQAYYEKIIRVLYTGWWHEMKYRKLKAMKNLSLIRTSPVIKKYLKEQPVRYDKRFSLTKNLFILYLRLFVI